jgi:GTP-binding protein
MIKNATFLISNTDISKCPAPTKPEFAFIGRSNVGKSSLINMLTGNKNLAKTSGRPGKTQLVNHFGIDDKWYMVDLPGYGFAKVSKTLKDDWNKMIRKYLVSRENLMVVFVLIDSRLEPQKVDLDFITWCGQNDVPIVLLFTKADKQSYSKNKTTVSKFLQATEMIFEEAPLYFITSATSGDGKDEVVGFIEEQVRDYYSKQN